MPSKYDRREINTIETRRTSFDLKNDGTGILEKDTRLPKIEEGPQSRRLWPILQNPRGESISTSYQPVKVFSRVNLCAKGNLKIPKRIDPNPQTLICSALIVAVL